MIRSMALLALSLGAFQTISHFEITDLLGLPERLGDVLHPTHAHAGQVHLDQRLLDARLERPVFAGRRRDCWSP
jgi:hypothetical protein